MSAGIDILVQSRLWTRQPSARATVRKAVAAAAANVARKHYELSVLLTDDQAIRQLNREWRGFDKPTNVLSFPAAAIPGQSEGPLGDIAIAYETLAREAEEEGKPFLHHLSHLAVHGFLHLVGHDHQSDGEAELMESKERDVLGVLGIPDPYAGGSLPHHA